MDPSNHNTTSAMQRLDLENAWLEELSAMSLKHDLHNIQASQRRSDTSGGGGLHSRSVSENSAVDKQREKGQVGEKQLRRVAGAGGLEDRRRPHSLHLTPTTLLHDNESYVSAKEGDASRRFATDIWITSDEKKRSSFLSSQDCPPPLKIKRNFPRTPPASDLNTSTSVTNLLISCNSAPSTHQRQPPPLRDLPSPPAPPQTSPPPEIPTNEDITITISPPEPTKRKRTTYKHGPIQLDLYVAASRKDSIASMAPFVVTTRERHDADYIGLAAMWGLLGGLFGEGWMVNAGPTPPSAMLDRVYIAEMAGVWAGGNVGKV